MKKRVVITGMGSVTPYGTSNEQFFESLVRGINAVKCISKFDTTRFRSKKSGEITELNVYPVFKSNSILRIPFLSKLALVSSHFTTKDARIAPKKLKPSEIGIFIGSEGSYFLQGKIWDMIVQETIDEVRPLDFQEVVVNAPASHISINQKIKGPCFAFAEGLNALYTAVCFLNNRNIKYCLVGAVDEYVRVHHEAYSYLNVLSPNDGGQEACRPFDKHRNGVIFSEGGAFLNIEYLDQACRRDCTIHGEILAVSMQSDGYKVGDNDPEGTGFELAMKKAVKQAHIGVEEIDWIIAAAPGTVNIDKGESKAINRVFGVNSYIPPVTSIKSSLGLLKCTGGILNIIAGLCAFKENVIPPTTHYETADPECDLDCVPNHSRKKEINTILINSFLWGGIYNSVIMRKYN